MKRFYCTICRRVKRVRNIPANTVTPESDNVYQRMGECNRHSAQPVVIVRKSSIQAEVTKAIAAPKARRRA